MGYFRDSRRIVVKVGTSTLTHATGHLNLRRIEKLVKVLSDMKNSGIQVVLVSSGAVSAGVAKLGFGTIPDAPEIKVFTEHGMGIKDATATLGGTFHNFGRRETYSKIDYIFTNGICDENESFVVPDEGVDGVYISDHFPVCALIEME